MWKQGDSSCGFLSLFFFSSHISDFNLGPCVAIVTNSPRTQTSGNWTSSHCESGSAGFLTSPVYGSGAGRAVFMWAATRAGHDGVGVCVCVSARACGCVCVCVCYSSTPRYLLGHHRKSYTKKCQQMVGGWASKWL